MCGEEREVAQHKRLLFLGQRPGALLVGVARILGKQHAPVAAVGGGEPLVRGHGDAVVSAVIRGITVEEAMEGQ